MFAQEKITYQNTASKIKNNKKYNKPENNRKISHNSIY